MSGQLREYNAFLAEQLRIYAVTDSNQPGREVLQRVEQAVAGGVTAIQLRRKQELGRSFIHLAGQLRRLTKERGVLFFVNDRVDIAHLVDADGVHVGQDDISCIDARRLLGQNKYIGVSAETVEQAVAAQEDGADYLGVGAVYQTTSKDDAGYTGLAGLKEIVAAVQIPVVGIGGITAHNAAAVMDAGACGVAVVSAIMSAPHPGSAAGVLASAVATKAKK